MSDSDLQLVKRYARHHAEDAFAELVRRRLNLVFSTALRQVRSRQLAEEVAQSVFTDLARQAERLAPDTILTAWLYQVTIRTAIDVVRREARRILREQVAVELNAMNATATDWTDIEPLLDEAMTALDATDRTAVLLRYFENKSLREVGQMLSTTEDAARKRLSRAVDHLREFFSKRGVTVGASALAVAISSNAVQSAPVGLAAAITAAALSGATITTTAVIAATKAIAMTTLQKTIIGAVLATAIGTGIYQARQSSQLREQNQTLQRQQAAVAGQIELLQQERNDAIGQLAVLRKADEGQHRNPEELLRLRGEVTQLRRIVAQRDNGPIPDNAPTANDAKGSKGEEELNLDLPKTSWAFVGYGTPEAALQTLMWARREGDIKSLLASLAPEFLEKARKAWGEKFEDELKSELPGKIPRVSDFMIVKKEVISDGEVRLIYRILEQDDLRNTATASNITAKRVGDEWKLVP